MFVGVGTVRRNSGGKRPEKRPGALGTLLPCSKSHTKVLPMKIPPIRCRARNEHATPGGYYLQHLSATLRADDPEREGARGLRVPAKRIEMKGRFGQVREGGMRQQ